MMKKLKKWILKYLGLPIVEHDLSKLSSEINEVRKLLCQHAEVMNINNERISESLNLPLEFSAYTIFLIEYNKGMNLIYDYPKAEKLDRNIMDKYYKKRE